MEARTTDIETLRARLSTIMAEAHEILDQLVAAGEQAIGEPVVDPGAPKLDADTFSVSYGGRICELGNSIAFRLLQRLARRPGVYVHHNRLIEVVWGQRVTASAIHAAVTRLRQRLRTAGLAELADAVEGSEKNHLVLRPIWRRAQKCKRNAGAV